MASAAPPIERDQEERVRYEPSKPAPYWITGRPTPAMKVRGYLPRYRGGHSAIRHVGTRMALPRNQEWYCAASCPRTYRLVLPRRREPAAIETLPRRFHRLADEWSKETANVSSLTAMANHPKYREIVAMGWAAVPLLLKDLQQSTRFWFPALEEITGIRPFDPRDAGNGKRMIEAWTKWGKRKQFI